MEFVLWEKLAGLEGKELVMLIAAAVVAAALIVLLVCLRKRSAEEAPGKRVDTRALVYGSASAFRSCSATSSCSPCPWAAR